MKITTSPLLKPLFMMVLHPPTTQIALTQTQIDPVLLAIGGLVVVCFLLVIALLIALENGNK